MWLYIAEDVASKFDISNYVVDRPLPITKNKAVVGVMKDEIDGQVVKKLLDYVQKPTAI